MNNTILGIVNNKLICQDNETIPNSNVLVVGGPGSLKTQSYTITNVLAETENTIILPDPKGEVYEATAGIKEKQGYEVHVINYMYMNKSSRQNPLDYVKRDIHATNVATKIVESENKDGKKDVWFNTQRQLLRALILYVIHELPPRERNFNGIIDFLQAYDTEKPEDGQSELDKVFSNLEFRHPARRAYELGFKKTKGEMQGSVISSLLGTIANFIDEEVGEFTSFSDFDLKDLGRKKMILYVIIPIMDNPFEGLINLLFSQMFSQLYELGAENGSKLPINVNFIFEEFVNLGKFHQYEEFLATCRGYGISVTTICQTITQLQNKYNRERAESIIGNHAVKICLTASNKTTAKEFSDLIGSATVKVETENQSRTNSKESTTTNSEGINYTRRSLIEPDEIMRMGQMESLLIFTSRPPMKVKKAVQWEVFPGIVGLYPKKQLEYKPVTSKERLARIEKLEKEFEEKMKHRKETTEVEVVDFEEFEEL